MNEWDAVSSIATADEWDSVSTTEDEWNAVSSIEGQLPPSPTGQVQHPPQVLLPRNVAQPSVTLPGAETEEIEPVEVKPPTLKPTTPFKAFGEGVGTAAAGVTQALAGELTGKIQGVGEQLDPEQQQMYDIGKSVAGQKKKKLTSYEKLAKTFYKSREAAPKIQETLQEQGEWLNKVAEQMRADKDPQTQQELEDAREWLKHPEAALPQNLPKTVTAAATIAAESGAMTVSAMVPGAGQAVMVGAEQGNWIDEVKKEGLDDQEVINAYSRAYGLLSGGIEAVGGEILTAPIKGVLKGKVAGRVAGKMLAKQAKASIAKRALNVLSKGFGDIAIGALGEGAEEYSQDYLSDVLKYAAFTEAANRNPDKAQEYLAKREQIPLNLMAKKRLESAFFGAIAGGFTRGALGTIAQAAAPRETPVTKTQQQPTEAPIEELERTAKEAAYAKGTAPGTGAPGGQARTEGGTPGQVRVRDTGPYREEAQGEAVEIPVEAPEKRDRISTLADMLKVVKDKHDRQQIIESMSDAEAKEVLRRAQGIPTVEVSKIPVGEAEEVVAKAREEGKTIAGIKPMEGTKYDRRHGEQLAEQLGDENVTFKAVQPGMVKGETRQPIRLLFNDETNGSTIAIKASDGIEELRKRIEENRVVSPEQNAQNIAKEFNLEPIGTKQDIGTPTGQGQYQTETHYRYKTPDGTEITIRPTDTLEGIKSYLARKKPAEPTEVPPSPEPSKAPIAIPRPPKAPTKAQDIIVSRYIKSGKAETKTAQEAHRLTTDLLDRADYRDIATAADMTPEAAQQAIEDVKAQKDTEDARKLRGVFARNLMAGQTVDEVLKNITEPRAAGGEVMFSKKEEATDEDIEKSLKKRLVRGDNLLNQIDKAQEIRDGKGKIDKNGYVVLYHIGKSEIVTEEQPTFSQKESIKVSKGKPTNLPTTTEEKKITDIVYKNKSPNYSTIRIAQPDKNQQKLTDAFKESYPDKEIVWLDIDENQLLKDVGGKYNGFMIRDTKDDYLKNKIFINRNTDKPAQQIAYHELTHFIQDNKEYSAAFWDAAKLTKKGKELVARKGRDEAMADIASELMVDPEFQSELSKNKSVFKAIYDELVKILNRISGALKKISGKEAEGYVENIDDVKETVKGILRRYSEGETKTAEERARFSEKEKADTFFSPLLKATQGLKQQKGTGEQMFNMLTKTPGVKEAEWKWIGLDDFLKGKQSVTRQEIEDFVRGNQVKVEEVDKVIPKGWSVDGLNKEADENLRRMNELGEMADSIPRDRPVPKEIREEFKRLSERNKEIERQLTFGPLSDKNAPKYQQYQLPGGENYREVLLTLPVERADIKAPDGHIVKGAIKPYSSYTSSHWEEPNVIAHLRLNDREVNGEKVLFIEEIQSDWAREAREKGIKDTSGQAEAAKKEYDDFVNNMREKYKRLAWFGSATNEERRTHEELAGRAADLAGHPQAVPSQPFLKNWEELTLKRVLRMAAEEGYDRVAWINGAQTAERYDLSKQISEVHYSGTNLKAYDKGGNTVISQTGVTEEQLPDYIGKEPARKLLEQPKQGTLRSIVGEDLKVGGEWASALYDRIIPKFYEKYGKKFGAKVEDVYLKTTDKIPTNMRIASDAKGFWVENYDQGKLSPVLESAAKAMDYRDKLREGKSIQQTIAITPEMRESVIFEGQPMFSRKEEIPAEERAIFSKKSQYEKELELSEKNKDKIDELDKEAFNIYDAIRKRLPSRHTERHLENWKSYATEDELSRYREINRKIDKLRGRTTFQILNSEAQDIMDSAQNRLGEDDLLTAWRNKLTENEKKRIDEIERELSATTVDFDDPEVPDQLKQRFQEDLFKSIQKQPAFKKWVEVPEHLKKSMEAITKMVQEQYDVNEVENIVEGKERPRSEEIEELNTPKTVLVYSPYARFSGEGKILPDQYRFAKRSWFVVGKKLNPHDTPYVIKYKRPLDTSYKMPYEVVLNLAKNPSRYSDIKHFSDPKRSKGVFDSYYNTILNYRGQSREAIETRSSSIEETDARMALESQIFTGTKNPNMMYLMSMAKEFGDAEVARRLTEMGYDAVIFGGKKNQYILPLENIETGNIEIADIYGNWKDSAPLIKNRILFKGKNVKEYKYDKEGINQLGVTHTRDDVDRVDKKTRTQKVGSLPEEIITNYTVWFKDGTYVEPYANNGFAKEEDGYDPIEEATRPGAWVKKPGEKDVVGYNYSDGEIDDNDVNINARQADSEIIKKVAPGQPMFSRKEEIPAVYDKLKKQPKPTLMKRVFKSSKSFKEYRDQLAADLFVPLSTRLRKIGKPFKEEMRKLEYRIHRNEHEDTKAIKPFLEGMKRMQYGDKLVIDLALKNGDEAKVNEIVGKYGLEKQYEKVRDTLDDIYQRAIDVGFDINYVMEYWPRRILDTEGVLNIVRESPEWDAISEAIRVEEEKRERPLSDMEKAKIADGFIARPERFMEKPGAIQKRSLDVIDDELDKFYDYSPSAMVQYIHEMNQAIEFRRFLGKGKKGTDKITDIEGGIGAYIVKAKEEGRLDPQQQDELIGLLRARFNYRPSGGVTQTVKDLGYITSMGSGFSSFLTQIGDLAWAYYVAGPIRATKATAKALAGRSELRKEDIGLERIAEEFRTSKGLGKALNKIFDWTLLTRMDAIGKEALINGLNEKLQGQARRKNAVFNKKMKRIFGDKAQGVIDDFAAGKDTEDTKYVLFSRLLDFQPMTLSEMPKMYLESPRGRLLYMLKTFTIKQLDAFRNEGLTVIREGVKEGNKGKIVKGMKNLGYMAALFIAANAGADELKDWLFGRKPNFEDKVWDNILRLFGLSRYIAWEARREGLVTAFWKLIAPPMDIIEAPFKDVESFSKHMSAPKKGEDTWMKIKNAESWKMIPFLGKHYYWWFGGGRQKELSRRKRHSVPAEFNREIGKQKRLIKNLVAAGKDERAEKERRKLQEMVAEGRPEVQEYFEEEAAKEYPKNFDKIYEMVKSEKRSDQIKARMRIKKMEAGQRRLWGKYVQEQSE